MRVPLSFVCFFLLDGQSIDVCGASDRMGSARPVSPSHPAEAAAGKATVVSVPVTLHDGFLDLVIDHMAGQVEF